VVQTSAHHDELDIDPRTSTPDEICRALLPWAQSLLLRALGSGAEEYAGIGIRSFDTSRAVPFRKFAARRIVWTAREEMIRFSGRFGDGRSRAQSAAFSLSPMRNGRSFVPPNLSYVSNPAARLEEHEALAQCLRRADDIEGPARWVVLGRFLGDFNNHTLGRLLGRAHTRIYICTADLRRSWRTD
jgi:hypothetical protein